MRVPSVYTLYEVGAGVMMEEAAAAVVLAAVHCEIDPQYRGSAVWALYSMLRQNRVKKEGGYTRDVRLIY